MILEINSISLFFSVHRCEIIPEKQGALTSLNICFRITIFLVNIEISTSLVSYLQII